MTETRPAKKERQARYYQINRDKLRAQSDAYYHEHAEEISVKKKAHYEANREEILARNAKYYERNREKITAKRKGRRGKVNDADILACDGDASNDKFVSANANDVPIHGSV